MSGARNIINSVKKHWQVVEDYLAGAEISIEELRRTFVAMRELLSKFSNKILSSDLSSEIKSLLQRDIGDFESNLAIIASFMELCAFSFKDSKTLNSLLRGFINGRIESILPSIRLSVYERIAELIDP